MTMLELRCGDSFVRICPQVGGAILAFEIGGRSVLRPTLGTPEHALETACFPLAPYANRIADGRLEFQGREIVLAANTSLSRHPLHGQAWLRAWEVEFADQTSARLFFRHQVDDWPWAYSVRQYIRLSARAITIALSLRNDDTVAMPAGLGFHPYFPRNEGTRLQTDVGGVWLADAEMLPTQYDARGAYDWSAGVDLNRIGDLVDHCHEPWSGWVRLTDGDGFSTLVEADSTCRRLHIFVPPGERFFCAEPVTHRPNPFVGNAEHNGIVAVSPGEVLQTQMCIRHV